MKKNYVIILLALFAITKTANATIHTVFITGIGPNPATTSATCGDTIKWQWNGGTDSVRSTTIPNCANPWKSQIDNTVPTYTVVVPCAGTYNYVSYVLNGTTTTYTAVINVTCSVGIPQTNNQSQKINLYPNPSNEGFFIDAGTANQTIEIVNLKGSLLLSKMFNEKTFIDTKSLAEGFYNIIIKTPEAILNRRLVVIH